MHRKITQDTPGCEKAGCPPRVMEAARSAQRGLESMPGENNEP